MCDEPNASQFNLISNECFYIMWPWSPVGGLLKETVMSEKHVS